MITANYEIVKIYPGQDKVMMNLKTREQADRFFKLFRLGSSCKTCLLIKVTDTNGQVTDRQVINRKDL